MLEVFLKKCIFIFLFSVRGNCYQVKENGIIAIKNDLFLIIFFLRFNNLGIQLIRLWKIKNGWWEMIGLTNLLLFTDGNVLLFFFF